VANCIASNPGIEAVTANASKGGVSDVVGAALGGVDGGVLKPRIMVVHFIKGVHVKYY